MQSGSVPNIPTELSEVRSVENLLLPMGWALRSSQVKRTRFTANQKDYLTKKFDLGEISGREIGSGVCCKGYDGNQRQ